MKNINRNGFDNLVRYYNGAENIPIVELKGIKDTIWMNMTDVEREKIAPTVLEYWTKEGFPYPQTNEQETTYEYDSLLKFNVNDIWKHTGNEITQAPLGLATANAYHPHKYKVKCKSYKIPYDNYEDKTVFKQVIIKTMTMAGNPLDRTKIRTMNSMYRGTQCASNFRPTVAKLIYEKYTPVGGKVLDPSLGYSGRLFGALSSHISHYEGCDPCVATYEGGLKLLKDITAIEKKRNKLSMFMDDGKRVSRLPVVKLHNIPFEEYKGPSNFFDTVFTSPPYFSVERYSNEENQSWKKYPEYESWVESFLRVLITTSHRVLKPGGRLMLNITGKFGKNCLEADTIRLGNEIFGEKNRQDDVHLQLSKIMGTKNKGKIENRNDRNDHRMEPIFHWVKNS